MNGTKHIARLGRSYDMGLYDLDRDLTGCTARLRIGLRSTSTEAGVSRLEISSASPPLVGLFDWDAAAGTLGIDLHQTQIATIGVGEWVFEIDVVRPTGEVLEGPSGDFFVRGQVPGA